MNKFKKDGFLLVEVLLALMILGVFYVAVMQALLDLNLALRQRYLYQVARLAEHSLPLAPPEYKKTYIDYLSAVLPNMKFTAQKICWQWQGMQCVKTQ